MSIWPFGNNDDDKSLEQAYIDGDISKEKYQQGLERKVDAEITKERTLREKRQEAKRDLGGQPSTYSEAGGKAQQFGFDQQTLDIDALENLRDMREDGGLISQLVHARALLTFGVGATFKSEDDDLQQLLNETFPNLANLLMNLGEDAYWYARAFGEVVETKGGDFDRIEGVEPWTMQPTIDEFGEIEYWEQHVAQQTQRFTPENIGTIILSESSTRDKTGISIVQRAADEINTYKENSESINKAIEHAGFPHNHWKVGSDGMGIIDDNELRRVRNIVQRLESTTQIVTGTDVEMEQIDPTTFDFTQISTHDIRRVATALGVPVELASVISEGLGSGQQSNLRLQMFEAQVEADRRKMEGQFVDEFVRPMLKRYSPYPTDSDVSIHFDPVFEQTDEKKSMLSSISSDMTVNERRDAFGLGDVDESSDVDGDSYVKASKQEDPEAGGEEEAFGGLFNRSLADILDKYTEDTGLSEDDFVPNESILDVIEPTLEFIDKEGLPNPDDQQEGAARINQLKDHIDNNEPLEPAFWQEISNFHARHRAQGNDECDESSLPEQAEESDFDKCHFDNGWFSDRTWGGDPAKEQADRIVEAIESTEGVELSDGDTDFRHLREEELARAEPWERSLMEMHSKLHDDSSTRLLVFSGSETPDFVKERIKETILGGQAIFEDIESIRSGERMQLREFMTEELAESDGWTIDGLTDQLLNLDSLDDRGRAETIARSETASILNTTRMNGYDEQFEDKQLFYWSGATQAESDRTTDACDWLINQTNPFEGGDPVPRQELQELIDEAPSHDDSMSNNMARPKDYMVHINERKQPVRAPENV